MRTRTSLLILLVLLFSTLSFKRAVKRCVHNGVPVFTHDYAEYKRPYATLFRKTAQKLSNDCICGKLPGNFYDFKNKEKTWVVIEPLYVNMENCTGIYAERVFGAGRKSVQPIDGWRQHNLFMIDGENFIAVPYLDTVFTRETLFNKNNQFYTLYSSEELERIYQRIKYGYILTEYQSFTAPHMIKEKGKIIYNAFHE